MTTKPLWQQLAPELNNRAISPDQHLPSVVFLTQGEWDRQGYCLWRCKHLRGDVIMVVDQARPAAAPEGYPVYTVDELAMIDALAPSTMRLVHAAKKAGAVVIKVEKRKDNAKI